MNKSFSQKTDADFLAAAENVVAECSGHMLEWGIPENDLAKLEGLVDRASVTYSANKRPSTRNRQTAEAKKLAFKELKSFISWFNTGLVMNLKVPSDALARMGIRSREHVHHDPIGLLPDPIELYIKQNHLSLDIYAHLPKETNPGRRMGAENRGGYMIRYWFEGDEGNVKQIISPTLHHILDYEAKEVGKKIIMIASWVNPSLLPNKWCREIAIVLI